MPARSHTGQPDTVGAWFAGPEGHALLGSEADTVQAALSDRPGLPWLWFSPVAQGWLPDGRGLALAPDGAGGWQGGVQCGDALPLATESVATVVLQHVASPGPAGIGLLDECVRVLVPGGRLWLFALNPLAPYRWRWRGHGLQASEPLTWRRSLRRAGMVPDGLSQGIGPRWRVRDTATLRQGAGFHAAYLLRSEKRSLPLTPTRIERRQALDGGLSTA